MLQQNAAIHNHENACPARFLCRLFVNYIFLHPNCRNFQLYRLIDHFLDDFGAAKDVHEIDLFWNIKERRVGRLAERFGDIRIHGNDSVTLSLEIGSDSVAWAKGIIRQANDGNGAGGTQNIRDGIGRDRGSHGGTIVVAWIPGRKPARTGQQRFFPEVGFSPSRKEGQIVRFNP